MRVRPRLGDGAEKDSSMQIVNASLASVQSNE